MYGYYEENHEQMLIWWIPLTELEFDCSLKIQFTMHVIKLNGLFKMSINVVFDRFINFQLLSGTLSP